MLSSDWSVGPCTCSTTRPGLWLGPWLVCAAACPGAALVTTARWPVTTASWWGTTAATATWPPWDRWGLPSWSSRRREKLFLAVKKYGTLAYELNQFSLLLPTHPTQHRQMWQCNELNTSLVLSAVPYWILLWSPTILNFYFGREPVFPSF